MWLNHVAMVTWNGQTAECKLGFCFCQLLSGTFSSKTWHWGSFWSKSTAWVMENKTGLIPDCRSTFSDALERWGDWGAPISSRGCKIFLCYPDGCERERSDMTLQRTDRAGFLSSEGWKCNVGNILQVNTEHCGAVLACLAETDIKYYICCRIINIFMRLIRFR